MKNILTVFLSGAFLSILFIGSAFCESPVMNDGEPVFSQDELKHDTSILDLVVIPNEAEASPIAKDAGENYEKNLNKGDDLHFHELETEGDKVQDEKEKIIL
ncbi:MAG: hypothetical protein ACI8PD_002007 [Nitrospinales bacterium]|jgi:hypothetical protein